MTHPSSKSIYLRVMALLLSMFGICFCLTTCSRQNLSTAQANLDFAAFTNALFQQEVSSNTISLHYTLQEPSDYGILDAPVTFGSFEVNPVTNRASLENCRAALQQFSYEDLSEKNQITYDVLDSYLDTAITGAEYAYYDEPIGPVTGIQAQLPVLLSEYQFQTEEDVGTYLSLLATLPDYFDTLITYEQKKAAQGLFMAAYTVDAVLEECRSFLDMGEENYLYTTFTERLDALEEPCSDEAYSHYVQQNADLVKTSVFPAYETLIHALNTLRGSETNTKGLHYLPEGDSYYEYVVKRDTGSSRSIEELQKLTEQQILADLGSIQAVLAAKAGTDISREAASRQLASRSGDDPATILNDLEYRTQELFPAAPSVTTRVKYVPAAMEQYLSPAFYMIPTLDNTSENVIYINQGRSMDGIKLYTTLAHEGYPGHLYQTTYYANQNPDPIRSILNFSGYVEGWATYTEMISYYFAPLSKEQATLLQKNSSVMLGLYALADMGIHYEGWTLMDTISFFYRYGIKNTEAIEEIYQLIISDPANYLKYYIGYLEFLQLKKEAIHDQGAAFDQKEFHEAILKIGPAPFDVVKKYLS